MKNAEAGSSSRDDFNDSDDAFVFKSPNLKRKLKAVSPKLRKRKAPERTELSKSVSSQTNQLPRKHPLNKSAPVASVKNKSKNYKGQSTLSPYFKPENSKDSGLKPEGEATESEPIEYSESPPSPPALDVDGNKPEPEVDNLEVSASVPPSNELESTPVPDEKSPKKTCWNLLLKKSPKVESFLCPLCRKNFEKSSQHVSHIKQCAKKKKIPTSELVRIIEGSKPSGSSTLGVIQKNIPSASEKENDRLAAEDLALAAALSLSMSETSGPGNSRIDKRILDSQKSTLERYGFTSTTGATGIPRKRKIKRVGTPVLTTRTAEERTRLLTEKAAVILLSQQESCFNRRKSVEDNQISSQFPYVAQDNRLWDLGEAEETGTWYLHDMKPFISPEKLMNRGNRQSPKTSQNTLQESPLEIEDALPRERTKVSSEEKRCGSLEEDWGRLVGNEELSDAVVETLDGQVAVHSLVLAIRCPGVTAAHLAAPCLTMSSASLLACLHYVYTGTWELTLSCDLDDALTIARVLGREDLVKIVSQALTESNGSREVIPSSVPPKYAEGGGFEVNLFSDLGSEVIPSSVSPKYAKGGGFEVDLGSPDGIMHENGEKDVAVDDRKVELRADPLETADTVPVEENEVHPDPTTGVIVDLTLSGSGSSTASNGDENSVKQSKEQSEERISMFLSSLGSQHSGVLKHTAEDHGEKEASFNASQNSECIDLFDDEMEIIPHESPKAKHLPGVEEESRTGVIKFNPSSQARLCNPPTDTSTDDGVKIVSAPMESTEELICLSSDSDQNEPCGDPKDEDENNRVITSPPIPSNLSQAFHETTPPARVQSQNEDVEDEPFLYDISLWEPPENDVNDVVLDFPRSPSQNLVTPKPRTPRKVLESPSKIIAESPELESPKDTTPKSSAWSELRNRKMRKSVARSRVSWSSRRRNSRIGCRKSFRPAQDVMLSESVINALDEPFFDVEPTAPGVSGVPGPSVVTPATPCLDNRPFVEVTPCITPSTRMVDNPSPRPSFSAMKTGSIKKHLQRYGLKKSLSKVKAKKILKHFYEELHPVVNTATGKLVKFLPKDEAASRSGKAKARGGKAPARGRTKASEPVASTSRAVIDPQSSTSKEGNVGRSDGDQCAAAVEDVSSGSEDFEDEISGVEEGDFEYEEDDVLTQACSTTMTVKEAVKKYIRDHKDVHIDVLMYKPVWVEAFRKNLQEYLKVKFKLLDIMTCLDELCIAFRSEAQAASNQERNARKAARRVKKKAPTGKKS